MKCIFLLLCCILLSADIYSQTILQRHDSLGRQTYIQYPDSSSVTHVYDKVGNLVSEIHHDPCSTKPRPVITATTPLTFCSGDSVLLSVGEGLSYQWSTGATTQSIWVTIGGKYNVVREDSFTIVGMADTLDCLLASDSVTVTVKPIPTLAHISNQNKCNGESLTVNFTSTVSGTTYAWTNDNSSIGLASTGTGNIGPSTITNSTSAPITAAIQVTPTAAGCVGGIQSFTITANPTPDVSIPSNQTLCSGDATAAVIFTGSVTGTTYDWMNDNASIGLLPNGTGNIGTFTAANSTDAASVATITVTPTANGCTGTPQNFTITVNPLPGTITGITTMCVGSTGTLSSTTSGGSWSSDNESIALVTDGLLAGISVGITNVSYTSVIGCSRFITVTVNAALAAISGPSDMCIGIGIALTHSTGGGTWSISNADIATVDSGIVTGVSVGSANITYIISEGCYAVKAIEVHDVPGVITGTTSACIGASSILTTSTSGGTWNSSNTAIATVDSSGQVTGQSPGSATITYMVGTGCYRTTTFTVLALPSAISGPAVVCVGSTTTLTDSTGDGIMWSSSNTSIATVGSSTGVVTGIADGNATITYTLSSGCYTTHQITVNTTPEPISGTMSICAGNTATLSSGTADGTWSSSNEAIATVGTSTGVMTGISSGNASITYTLGSGCYRYTQVTIDAALTAISGMPNICLGVSTSLSHAISGGIWISSNTTVATIDSATGLVNGVTLGIATITYFVSGCYKTIGVTVNPQPSAITGTATVCVGATTALTNSTDGGISWTSSNMSVATVSDSGIVSGISAGTSVITYLVSSGCYATRVVTVTTTPDPITGSTFICTGNTTNLSSTTTGGTWSSSNASVATVNTSGLVSGVSAGNANITYSVSTSCRSIAAVTVGAMPAVISGTLVVCEGANTTLSSATPGYSWSSASPSIASIGSTGIVSGVSAGTAIISYTHPLGCSQMVIVTVNAAPADITGSLTICTGSTTPLSSSTVGGTWLSSTPSIATINSGTGIVSGINIGTSNITYTLSGCKKNAIVTVTASPSDIVGTTNVCVGSTTTFTHPISTGTWTSGNPTIATVGSSTGLITGISAGTVTITYTLDAGCFKTKVMTVNGVPAAIMGNTSICVGSTSVLTCAIGSSWSSSNTAIATIGSTSGVVTGIATGTAYITFHAATTGCINFTIVTIMPLPTAISGTFIFCQGATTSLESIGTTGGTWVSSNVSKATIGSTSGIVTGINGGTSNITYTWTNTCKQTSVVTINPLPVAGAIVGPGNVSVDNTISLSSSSPGGTWASGNVARATIVTGTGEMTGVSVGTVLISYFKTNGCGSAFVTRIFNVVTPRPETETITGDDTISTFKLYPNPSTGKINIETNVKGIFTVFTIDGKQIEEYVISEKSVSLVLPKNLAAGVYICRFNGNNGYSVTTRLVFIPY